MADRLAILLGIKSTELLVAQDDIRSIGKTVDTLLMEFDQQAFKAYLSSCSEGSAAGHTRQTLRTGSPTLSPVHAVDHNIAKQSPEANKGPCRVFPRVVGGPSPPVKRNHNAKRHQYCRGRHLQAM